MRTIITGGAGGMGLATAKLMGRTHHVTIADVNEHRLTPAIAELRAAGVSCDAVVCDIAEQTSVDSLIGRASGHGPLQSVIHAAGVSPQMAPPATILRINAIGTVHVMNACHRAAGPGFALVNVASMAAHLLPPLAAAKWLFPYALVDPDAFVKRALLVSRLAPNDYYRRGIAYAISKSFVVWLGRKNAASFGAKGARILSVSPGTFDTEMGRLEMESNPRESLGKGALGRSGRAEEIAELLTFCASDKASYLTGTDILCDGGTVATRSA